MIQVGVAGVAGVQLDLMFADRSAGAEPRDRGSARRDRRDPADLGVVPADHVGAFHRPPSETLDPDFDWRADRTFAGRDLESGLHLDAALRNRDAAGRRR